MSLNLELFYSILSVITVLAVAYVIWRQKRRISRIEYMDAFIPGDDKAKKEESFRSSILSIIRSENKPSLKLLMELYHDKPEKDYFYSARQKRDVLVLRKIQGDLRRILKDTLHDEDFNNVKDDIIQLIDKSSLEVNKLQEKKPFEDLGEPEKSLMMDLLEELPKEKEMPRQKALQLAEIIKNKYQNIEKLQLDNKKASAWSRLGAFGTMFFGALSLVLSIYSFFT